MINKLIKLLILPVALCSLSTAFADDTKTPVWNSVPTVKGAEYLFIGFQEAGFIRATIGEWLPIALLSKSRNDDIYFAVRNVTHKDKKVVIQLHVYNKTAKKKTTLSWEWTVPSGVSDVEVGITGPGVIDVKYPETGENREIRLANVRDIPAAKEHFEISKAAPMWKWRTRPWGEAE